MEKVESQTYMPKRVWIAMKQGDGPICEVVVKEGEKVTAGTVIGYHSPPEEEWIYASITGIVKRIDKEQMRPHELMAVVIIEGIEAGIDTRDKPPLFVGRSIEICGGVRHIQRLSVPIGTAVSELLEVCGGLRPGYDLVISGGPLTGRALNPEHAYVQTNTYQIMALKTLKLPETPCIHCGLCAKICPSRLRPYVLEKACFKALGPEATEELLRCQGCGACSYVCPAKRRLMEHIVRGQKMVGDKERWGSAEKTATTKRTVASKRTVPLKRKGQYVHLKNRRGQEISPMTLWSQSPPHVRASYSTKTIMEQVIISLLPVVFMTVVRNGFKGALLFLSAIGGGCLVEGLWHLAGRTYPADQCRSTIITAILLVLLLPAQLPWWIIGLICGLTIGIGKMMFGGLGHNVVNLAAFGWMIGYSGIFQMIFRQVNLQGRAMIESCSLSILIGAGYLLFQGVISLWIGLFYLFILGVGSLVFDGLSMTMIFTGASLLGAVYMTQDYVTTPVTYKGQLGFVFISGILTAGCMNALGMTPGVCMGILIANLFSPYLDRAATFSGRGDFKSGSSKLVD